MTIRKKIDRNEETISTVSLPDNKNEKPSDNGGLFALKKKPSARTKNKFFEL
jgi:hypothetical protein